MNTSAEELIHSYEVDVCSIEDKQKRGVITLDEFRQRLQAIQEELAKNIDSLIQQEKLNCNAVPDDQPNDVHIKFYNQGFRDGQLKLLERIERLNVAEPCETECDDVRHAKHTGAYEHSVYIDSELNKLKAEIRGE